MWWFKPCSLPTSDSHRPSVLFFWVVRAGLSYVVTLWHRRRFYSFPFCCCCLVSVSCYITISVNSNHPLFLPETSVWRIYTSAEMWRITTTEPMDRVGVQTRDIYFTIHYDSSITPTRLICSFYVRYIFRKSRSGRCTIYTLQTVTVQTLALR